MLFRNSKEELGTPFLFFWLFHIWLAITKKTKKYILKLSNQFEQKRPKFLVSITNTIYFNYLFLFTYTSISTIL